MIQPIIPIRGQAEISRGGTEREYTLVVKHVKLLILYVLAITGLTISNILIIGPSLGFSAILVLGLVVFVKYLSVTEGSARQAIAILGLSGITFWLFLGFDITDSLWWSARCEWAVRNKLLFLIFTAPIIGVMLVGLYRSAYEIVDPNWSPTISSRPSEWGILWPWKAITEEEEEEQPMPNFPQTEALPRPVANFGSRGVESKRVEAGETEQYYDRVIAPSGRVVKVSTLLEFAHLAPRIGAVFEVWKDRPCNENGKQKWDLQLWQDVVDEWAIFQVVTPRKPKTKTKVLVRDPSEAEQRLRENIDREAK